MKEQLVSFDTAKLAKKKGFDIIQDKGYYNHGGIELVLWVVCEDYNDQKDFIVFAPTQSLLQKWLREEHDIVVYILPHAPQKRIDVKVSLYSACLWYKNEYQSEVNSAKTYEEALEKGLQEALKLIKS